ncbi:MAG: hypothetical protein LQ338_006560, partial [Usnochroma carphineum]
MKLLCYISTVTLLQPLLQISASTIPAHVSVNRYHGPTALYHRQIASNESLLRPSPDLVKRIWPDPYHTFFVVTQAIGLRFTLRFNVLEMVPDNALAAMAANDLVQFYRAAFAVANVLWAPDEPQRVRRAKMGGLVLVFSSEAPIAWDFVKAFFEHV